MALFQQSKKGVAAGRRSRISRPQIAGLAVAGLVLVAAAVFAFGLGSEARAGGQADDAQTWR